MDKIPELREKVMTQGSGSENIKKYVWDTCFGPQMG